MTRQPKPLSPLLALAALALCAPLSAQETSDPSERERMRRGDRLVLPADAAVRADLPGRGLDQQRVRQGWGEPRERIPAVGDPPIGRWIYDGFTVYFERHLVLHAVPHPGTARRP